MASPISLINILRPASYSYINYRAIATAEQNLGSADPELRMKAVRSLYSFYKRFKKVLTYYRGCHIMTIFAEHGHRPAAQQMGALAIDWRKAGFEVITMILEVKHASKLDYESLAPFDDLLNRAADALPWKRETLMIMVEDYFNEKAGLATKRKEMQAEAEAIETAEEVTDEDMDDQATEEEAIGEDGMKEKGTKEEDTEGQDVSGDNTEEDDSEEEEIELPDIEVEDSEDEADEEADEDGEADELRMRFDVHDYPEDKYRYTATKLVFKPLASRITVVTTPVVAIEEVNGNGKRSGEDFFEDLAILKKQRS